MNPVRQRIQEQGVRRIAAIADLEAREILRHHRVAWIFAYDSDRVAQNSAAVLNQESPVHPLCRVLDRTPGQAPRFLIFSVQTAAFKLYRVAEER